MDFDGIKMFFKLYKSSLKNTNNVKISELSLEFALLSHGEYKKFQAKKYRGNILKVKKDHRWQHGEVKFYFVHNIIEMAI